MRAITQKTANSLSHSHYHTKIRMLAIKVNHSQENKHSILTDNESKTSPVVCLGDMLDCVTGSSSAAKGEITAGRKNELQFDTAKKNHDMISPESEASSFCVTNDHNNLFG